MKALRLVVLFSVICVALFAQTAASHAEYPDRPIRLLLPFPAGGAVDIVTRVMAAKMGENLGKTVIIENKSGAGGIVATDAVAKATPDGYTLLITTPNHTINAALQPSLPYDTEKDLLPVSVMAEVPEVLVSNPAAPFKTFAEFVAYAKQNPGKLDYASAGIGTLPHLSMELLLQKVGIKVTLVEPGGYATDWRGASSSQSQPLAAYDGLRERLRAMSAGRALADPAATAGTILQLVDAETPPLRLFLGAANLELARREYAARLETWQAWQEAARAAQGDAAQA